MSHALHNVYQPVSADPVRDFLRDAPVQLHLDPLVDAFAAALAVHQATAHCCCAIADDGSLTALFGDDPGLAASADRGLIDIGIETPDGGQLVLLISARSAVDRNTLSRLRLISTLYVTHAIALFEAADEEPADGRITPIEQQCFTMLLTGCSYLDIAERLDRSAPAVGVHLRRAVERLGVSSIAEASALVASRGMIQR